MRADRGFQWLWSHIQAYDCFPNIINVFGMLSASYAVYYVIKQEISFGSFPDFVRDSRFVWLK